MILVSSSHSVMARLGPAHKLIRVRIVAAIELFMIDASVLKGMWMYGYYGYLRSPLSSISLLID